MKNKIIRIAVCGGISVLILSNTSINLLAAPVNTAGISSNSIHPCGKLVNLVADFLAVLRIAGSSFHFAVLQIQ